MRYGIRIIFYYCSKFLESFVPENNFRMLSTTISFHSHSPISCIKSCSHVMPIPISKCMDFLYILKDNLRWCAGRFLLLLVGVNRIGLEREQRNLASLLPKSSYKIRYILSIRHHNSGKRPGKKLSFQTICCFWKPIYINFRDRIKYIEMMLSLLHTCHICRMNKNTSNI